MIIKPCNTYNMHYTTYNRRSQTYIRPYTIYDRLQNAYATKHCHGPRPGQSQGLRCHLFGIVLVLFGLEAICTIGALFTQVGYNLAQVDIILETPLIIL